MDAVRFVRHVKKGPLTETSPMLSDISAIPTWAKARAWEREREKGPAWAGGMTWRRDLSRALSGTVADACGGSESRALAVAGAVGNRVFPPCSFHR